jgi:hypothetical protein
LVGRKWLKGPTRLGCRQLAAIGNPTGGTFVTLSCPAVTLADALASRSTPEDPTENPTAPVTVVDWLCA